MTWQKLQNRLADDGYISTPELAMALHVCLNLERPILLEGDAGVGSKEWSCRNSQIDIGSS